ncbi:ABC transporter substrate-binding protein [Massilia sp. TS11]|uniref:ABC transporter substrate-binding protein n=1 Tax=Massilia sp. TS11 TaxID=2908003 RepID=UPI001EDB8086|nr:ABC transporter substrate-binding protein [Massilia sp. TS11]MCG2586180.1 ABC transporter substrate-binding protein [Massilia sp. TS11]
MHAWRSRKLALWLASALAGTALALAAWSAWQAWRAAQQPPARPLIVAVATQLGSGALYVAQEQKLFERYGLRIKLRPFVLGREALQSVLNGNSDLAVLADTPLALALLRGEALTVLATLYESTTAMAVVARTDRGIQHGQDLAGKRIGTAHGTNGQYFLERYLDELGLGLSAVRVVDLAPEQFLTALETGAVDAVTLWYPDRARLAQRLPHATFTLQPRQPFVYRFVLAGRPATVRAEEASLRLLLQALRDANEAIRAEPDQAQAQIAQSNGLDPAALGPAFQPGDYVLSMQPSLLTALQDQADWARARGLVPERPRPDFRASLDPRLLASVAPAAASLPPPH